MGKAQKKRSGGVVTRNSPFSRQFQTECKCNVHGVKKSSDSPVLHRNTGKDYIKAHWIWLVDQGHVGEKSKWVCSDCLNYAAEKINRPETESCGDTSRLTSCGNAEATGGDTEVIGPEVQSFLTFLNTSELSDMEISELLHVLGRKLSSTVFNDSISLLKQYKDLEHLCNQDHKEFLSHRPKGLISFLEGVTNQTVSECEPKKLNALSLLVEQLYFVRNNNFIGAFSFSQHLVKWSLCGSKTASTVDGSTTPAGSVTSMQKVMKASSTEKNVPPTGDIDVFFDNTQRTGKTTRVRESGTTPVHVATNVVFIQNNPTTEVQKNATLKPGNWLGSASVADAKSKIENYENELSKTFRSYRYSFQTELLNQVIEEVDVDETSEITDHVSYSIAVKERLQNCEVCPKCCGTYSKSSLVCDECGFNARNLAEKKVSYDLVPNGFGDKGKAVVKIGEIIGVNPNSKNTVRQVLEDITEQCAVGNERQWVRLGCDGVPYRIADGLIKNTVKCNLCGEVFDLRDTSFAEHVEQVHGDQDGSVSYSRVFHSLFLVPGAGHTEINLLRALFSLVRYIFLEKVADNLGFKSKAAKEFIVKGGNHHVTWQVFFISLMAFGLEMLYEYVVDCSKKSIVPSVEHFRDVWMHTVVKNSNFLLFYDLIFDWFLGLHCFRSGVRRGHSEYVMCGRQKVVPIMFTGKHQIYQNLIYSDMKLRIEAPPEISDYIMDNESFSASGDSFSGEGGDYITENENRVLKSHLPPGVPTLDSWIYASRCHEHLQKNRDAVFSRAGIKDPGKSASSVFNFEFEVQMVRRLIRESGILKEPSQEQSLKSLDGEQLHPELVNITKTARKNYIQFLENPTKAELQPVFVTPGQEREFNDVNNWTIQRIDERALAMLGDFSDADSAILLREMYKAEIAKANKAKHIQFYQSVKETLEEQLTEDSNDTNLFQE